MKTVDRNQEETYVECVARSDAPKEPAMNTATDIDNAAETLAADFIDEGLARFACDGIDRGGIDDLIHASELDDLHVTPSPELLDAVIEKIEEALRGKGY